MKLFSLNNEELNTCFMWNDKVKQTADSHFSLCGTEPTQEKVLTCDQKLSLPFSYQSNRPAKAANGVHLNTVLLLFGARSNVNYLLPIQLPHPRSCPVPWLSPQPSAALQGSCDPSRAPPRPRHGAPKEKPAVCCDIIYASKQI